MIRFIDRSFRMACILGAFTRAAAAAPPEPADFFESRVRPVLAQRCLSCHGPREAKAGLRLDSRGALLKGSDAGPVVTPGDPEDSLLIEAVRRAGPLKMPPKHPLEPADVADLEAWVRMGLPWPDGAIAVAPEVSTASDHWAFRPPGDVPVPATSRGEDARSTIDAFILDALRAKGLTPSPEADRRTLIRRVSFDLTGLPPTPEEVAAFEADGRPDAYEALVDRLLASPHHGERWGRHWLDVARYADTKGYVFFQDADFPWAYTYRDWVTRALNEDLAYDRYLIQQLAADRLPPGPDHSRSLAALGFIALGGRFMNNPHDIIDDRIDAVTRGLMGLTVACARCHDHKFDPVSQADYYALHGVFASTTEPEEPPLLDPPPKTAEYQKFDDELKTREAKLAAFVEDKHAELVASAKSRAGEYLLVAQAAVDRPSTGDFMLIADVGDLNPTMIVRWRSLLERTRRRHHPALAPWHALATMPPDEPAFAERAASLLETLLATQKPDKPVNPIVVRALAEARPRSLAEVAAVYSRLLNGVEAVGGEHHRRALLEGRDAGPLPIPAAQELWEVFHGPDAPPDLPPTAISKLELLPDRASQAKLQELQKAVETWRATGPGAPPRATSVVDLERPIQPRIFLRGDPNNPGPFVTRRWLKAFEGPASKPFSQGSGRLELAREIASPSNPLTARVLVNRVWMQHVGTPLVETPGDFGLRSAPPSHPGLLDHLAHTFMHEDRWSLKALHRRIVLSATYRQASDDRPEARLADPENRLYWRMNRRRLDFESLRDALLAVSGMLDRT
ncbi:MAG: PSD1 and planctomycete cytochrome C domain-containing protein, partial [Isosphaeraceae bacterium]